jgi:hypothetical protein
MFFGNFMVIRTRTLSPLDAYAAACKNICAERDDKKAHCQTNEKFPG